MARFLLDWLHRRQLFLGVAVCLLIIAVALVWRVHRHRRSAGDGQWVDGLPVQVHDNGYVSSDVCRSCHPQQYASWDATYHRTMTQIAMSDTVVGRFDNVTLEAKGHPYRLYRQGEEFWVELDDPDWRSEKTLADLRQQPRRFRLFDGVSQQPPRVKRRVVMVTGSHHQQRYCLACHSVGGQSRPAGSAEQPKTQVGELGIACEACHGPGAEHVRANHNPQRRYRLHLSDAPDPTIVHPGRLSAPQSSQVWVNAMRYTASNNGKGGCTRAPIIDQVTIWNTNATSYATRQRRRNPGCRDGSRESRRRWNSGSGRTARFASPGANTMA